MSFESEEPSGSRQRSPLVDAQIKRIQALHQAVWVDEIPDLLSETLVHMAGLVRKVDQKVFDRLVVELVPRVNRIAEKMARGFKQIPTEEIVLEVEHEIVKLIMTHPSPQSEFLEIVFITTVRRRTLKSVRSYLRSVFGHIGDFSPGLADDDDDSEEIERPLEFLPDRQPSTEAVLIQKVGDAEKRHLVAVAYSAIKKRRHRQAFILHYVVGMPVESKEGKPNLAAYFRVKPAVVWYWLEVALAQTREALGVTL